MRNRGESVPSASARSVACSTKWPADRRCLRSTIVGFPAAPPTSTTSQSRRVAPTSSTPSGTGTSWSKTGCGEDLHPCTYVVHQTRKCSRPCTGNSSAASARPDRGRLDPAPSILGSHAQKFGDAFEGLVVEDEFAQQHLLSDHRAELAGGVAQRPVVDATRREGLTRPEF